MTRLTPYPTQTKTGHQLRDDDLSANWRAALEWSDMLIIQKGGRVRKPRELDDAEREAAWGRMAQLLNGVRELTA